MMREYLVRAASALEGGEAAALVACYADGFTFVDTAGGETITSRPALLEYYTGLFGMPAVAFSDVEFVECGEQGFGRWTWSGLNADSGAAFSVRGASILELGDGGILREEIYYDPGPALGSGG